MNKRDWTVIAEALGALREEIRASWPPAGGFKSNDPGVHERKLWRAAQLHAIDRAARAICHAIKATSTRFAAKGFLDVIGVGKS